MHSVGVNTAELRTIKRVLSAILHLGNVSFKDNGEGHLPTVDGDRSRQHMDWACELLGIDNVRSDISLHVLTTASSTFLLFVFMLWRPMRVCAPRSNDAAGSV